MSVAIVIPCYNEAHRLDLSGFLNFVQRVNSVHFIFVDDGSVDNTRERINSLVRSEAQHFSMITLNQNAGKQEAVRQGILFAMQMKHKSFRYIGYWDADLATPLEAILDFVDELANKPNLILTMGARVDLLGRNVSRKLLRHYLGRVFATFASVTLNVAVYDTQCGAKIFRNENAVMDVFNDPFSSGWIFDVEILARLKFRKQFILEERVSEYPLQEWNDVRGSKVKPSAFFRAFYELTIIFIKYRF